MVVGALKNDFGEIGNLRRNSVQDVTIDFWVANQVVLDVKVLVL